MVVVVTVKLGWATRVGSVRPNKGAKSRRHHLSVQSEVKWRLKLCAQRSLNNYRGHTSGHAHGRTTGTFFRIERDGKVLAIINETDNANNIVFQER